MYGRVSRAERPKPPPLRWDPPPGGPACRKPSEGHKRENENGLYTRGGGGWNTKDRRQSGTKTRHPPLVLSATRTKTRDTMGKETIKGVAATPQKKGGTTTKRGEDCDDGTTSTEAAGAPRPWAVRACTPGRLHPPPPDPPTAHAAKAHAAKAHAATGAHAPSFPPPPPLVVNSSPAPPPGGPRAPAVRPS